MQYMLYGGMPQVVLLNEVEERYYIQSALEMPTDEKVRQEMASLRNIDDSFKKIVVVGTHQPLYKNEDGFTIMSIYDFLLEENSLEL